MNTDDKLHKLARETFIELHRRGPLTPDEEGRIIRSALEQAYDAGYVRREQDIQNLRDSFEKAGMPQSRVAQGHKGSEYKHDVRESHGAQ